jgi:glutamate formiminotransferase
MNRIVACVPNFSEGRRTETIDAIAAAMTAVRGVHLLDRQMDADHHRAVITIAGPPESIGEAALCGVEAAIARIDMTRHRGQHPRIGAVDVVPFVPIRGVTLAECVEIARQTGQAIAERFKIPVYLYEAAATRPERADLEAIRRGQFEALRGEIADPDRRPDFGEPRLHPTAGATAVGARKALIAWNVNLDTSDLGVAQTIAKRVRFSGGGLHYVKAMGVLAKDRNQAQVSMNLTDFERTSMERVFETVRLEAERCGVRVVGSELVGLVPEQALTEAAASFLRVGNFTPGMILENRLAAAMSGTPAPMADAVRPFVDRIASAEPLPGGGSAAAMAGAMGAALGQMALRITKGKKNHRQYADRYVEALDRLAALASTLLGSIDDDAEAYRGVIDAHKLPNDAPTRDRAIQDALVHAVEVPERAADCAAEALRVLAPLEPLIYPLFASDLQVGVELLRSCLRGAVANMRANLGGVLDPAVRARHEARIAALESSLREPGSAPPDAAG